MNETKAQSTANGHFFLVKKSTKTNPSSSTAPSTPYAKSSVLPRPPQRQNSEASSSTRKSQSKYGLLSTKWAINNRPLQSIPTTLPQTAWFTKQSDSNGLVQ